MTTDDTNDDTTEPDILVEKDDLLTYLKESMPKKDKFINSYTITGWTIIPFTIIFLLITAIIILGGIFTLSIVFLFLTLIWAIVYIPIFSISYLLAKIFKKRK